MVKYKKILLLCLFGGISLSSFSYEVGIPSATVLVSEVQEELIDLEVTINSITKIELQNVPKDGYLEVFSILGVRVARVSIKDSVGKCFIDLSKGLYILKAGEVAQKIIVK